MFDVWIQEEQYNCKDHYVKINNKIKAYSLSANENEKSYIETNKQFLFEMLNTQKRFPLYITFIAYDDYSDIKEVLEKAEIEYKVEILDETNTVWTDEAIFKYNLPCFRVRANNSDSLKIILDTSYYLAAQNEFYAICYLNNLIFKTEEIDIRTMKNKKVKKNVSIPYFNISESATLFTIEHDGAGFYIFSNEEKYSSIERLICQLPKKTVITQINDNLIE